MKNLTFAACLLAVTLVTSGPVSAQVRSVAAANRPSTSTPPAADKDNRTTDTRARVLSQHAKGTPAAGQPSGSTLQAQVKSRSNYSPQTGIIRTTSSIADNTSAGNLGNRARTVLNKPAQPDTTPLLSNHVVTSSNTTATVAPSQVYRVGVRDVLDIQLAGHSGKQSTLFTVFEGGLLEYPLAGDPIAVAGLTTTEVAALLRQRIKILDNPTVVVNVRDYASHPVTITGFVRAPGMKYLRREAVPLYTILAEALMLPEAARAAITRQGRAPIVVDLKDANLAATLVLPGDVVRVSGVPAGPTEFLFVGGEINSPGQKPFHAGETLTQAILASGGTTKNAGPKVRVSRQRADGRLVNEEYNLRKIEDGKTPDPVLQKGDRILVSEDR